MSSNIEPILEFPPSSFLSDFIIEKITVDGIDDSRTSKARIQFSGKYCGYEMTVNWKDGKKEGVGLILYPDGEPYMEMTFVNDLAEGTVLKKDEYGQIVLRGVLEHGVECGLFEEFDDEEVIWRGFYRNGKRYSILEEQELEGLYLEVSEDGKLLSVSEYDDKWRKNGRCYEVESGHLKRECVYENGIRKRMIQEFTDDGLMIEYDDNGEIVDEEVFEGDMIGFMIHPEMMIGTKEYYIDMNENGELLSVSEYDEDGLLKNGKCFEYEEGRLVRECEYEDGVKQRVIREFTDDGLWIEYDDNGDIVYEEELEGDMMNGFIREEKGSESDSDEEIVDEEVEEIVDGFVVHPEMEGMEGFYIDMNENGELLSVSEYDESGLLKNGRCFECEGGYVKRECVYENGMKKRMIREFTDDGLMIEYDDNGKRVYEGEFEGDMMNGFIREEKGSEYESDGEIVDEEVEEIVDGFVVHPEMEGMEGFYIDMNENGELLSVSEYDESGLLKNGRCFECEGGYVKRECVYENGMKKRMIREFTDDGLMIEYDDNGKRVYEGEFEGDMMNGFIREEKGSEYGSDGKSVLYVGGWKNGLREGYGSEFKGYSPVYIGEWKNGMRDGKGKELNENGEVIRSGVWVRGNFSSSLAHVVWDESTLSPPSAYVVLSAGSNPRPSYKPRSRPVHIVIPKSARSKLKCSSVTKRSLPSVPKRSPSVTKRSPPSASKRSPSASKRSLPSIPKRSPPSVTKRSPPSASKRSPSASKRSLPSIPKRSPPSVTKRSPPSVPKRSPSVTKRSPFSAPKHSPKPNPTSKPDTKSKRSPSAPRRSPKSNPTSKSDTKPKYSPPSAPKHPANPTKSSHSPATKPTPVQKSKSKAAAAPKSSPTPKPRPVQKPNSKPSTKPKSASAPKSKPNSNPKHTPAHKAKPKH